MPLAETERNTELLDQLASKYMNYIFPFKPRVANPTRICFSCDTVIIPGQAYRYRESDTERRKKLGLKTNNYLCESCGDQYKRLQSFHRTRYGDYVLMVRRRQNCL